MLEVQGREAYACLLSTLLLAAWGPVWGCRCGHESGLVVAAVWVHRGGERHLVGAVGNILCKPKQH